jgi:hypothetical protein
MLCKLGGSTVGTGWRIGARRRWLCGTKFRAGVNGYTTRGNRNSSGKHSHAVRRTSNATNCSRCATTTGNSWLNFPRFHSEYHNSRFDNAGLDRPRLDDARINKSEYDDSELDHAQHVKSKRHDEYAWNDTQQRSVPNSRNSGNDRFDLELRYGNQFLSAGECTK